MQHLNVPTVFTKALLRQSIQSNFIEHRKLCLLFPRCEFYKWKMRLWTQAICLSVCTNSKRKRYTILPLPHCWLHERKGVEIVRIEIRLYCALGTNAIRIARLSIVFQCVQCLFCQSVYRPTYCLSLQAESKVLREATRENEMFHDLHYSPHRRLLVSYN